MLSSDISNLAKISLIGHPAVGKTTILKLLSEKVINKIYLPTQGFDLNTVEFDNFRLKVWDFGGQKSYLNMYLHSYLLGTDILLIVTDSTKENVMSSRDLIKIAKKAIENDCPIIAIANKQDLLDKDKKRLAVDRVQDLLDIRTYGLTAIDPTQREKLLDIIKKELNKAVSRREVKIK
ncbi:MAG: ADP-ribosylation factor-like protein [Promethearchaeota archaeon]